MRHQPWMPITFKPTILEPHRTHFGITTQEPGTTWNHHPAPKAPSQFLGWDPQTNAVGGRKKTNLKDDFHCHKTWSSYPDLESGLFHMLASHSSLLQYNAWNTSAATSLWKCKSRLDERKLSIPTLVKFSAFTVFECKVHETVESYTRQESSQITRAYLSGIASKAAIAIAIYKTQLQILVPLVWCCLVANDG